MNQSIPHPQTDMQNKPVFQRAEPLQYSLSVKQKLRFIFSLTFVFFFLFTHFGPVLAQAPTMQVACGLEGGELEYINLVKKFPEWFYSQSNTWTGGRITSDYRFENFNGEILDIVPNQLPLTTDGSYYPHHVPIIDNHGNEIYPELWLFPNENGTYTVLADGTGTLSFVNAEPEHLHLDSSQYRFTNGIQFTVEATGLTPPDNSGYPATTGSGPNGLGNTRMWIRIVYSDSLNPVRNIRVLPPDYTDSQGVNHHFIDEYTTNKFHPQLIDDLQKYSAFRCMDLCHTNNSTTRYWKQTRQEKELGSGSIPYIDMIDLANEANRDIWLNLPHLASDGFVDTLASLVKERLNPGLKAYIEYSNEVWNIMFNQTSWADQQGRILGWDEFAGGRFYARRSGEIFKRFENVFANERNRVIFVSAWQMGIGNEFLGDAYNDPLINLSGTKPDAFAVAPYFYRVYTQPDIGVIGECLWQHCDSCVATHVPSVQQILDDLTYSVRNDVSNGLIGSMAGPNKYHIPLINYEGGPHAVGSYGAENSCELTDNLAKANRSNEMETLYTEWMDTVQASGVAMLNQFVDRGGWSKWGCWGMVEYRGQDDASPKYRALTNWIDAHPIVLDKQAPTVPGTPVKDNSTASSISLSWTPSIDNGYIVGYDVFLNGTYYGSSNCQENNSAYTLSGLEPDSTYSITIRARDLGGNYSPPSGDLLASTSSPDIQKPTTVINLSLVQKSSNEIKIRWTPSTDNDKVAQYRIEWEGTSDSTLELSYTLKNLTPAHTYKIFVFAEDPSGNVSDTSYLVVTTGIDPLLKAHKASNNMKIDGKLSEKAWSMDYELKKLVSYASSPGTDSISVGLLWDDDFLYVGARAKDNILLKGVYYWDGDGFEIMVDGNNNRSSTYEEGFDVKYTLQWDNRVLYGNDTTKVLSGQQNIQGGWTCEMAIPWSKLGITTPSENLSLGFNLIYDDSDFNVWGRNRQYTLKGDESLYTSCTQFPGLTLSTDTVPPLKPANIVVSNITMGSAKLSWSNSWDQNGILGYDIYLNGKKVNGSPVQSTLYQLEGLDAGQPYTVSVVAIDRHALKSEVGNERFLTKPGNELVHFDSEINTLGTYGTVRNARYGSGYAEVPFTADTLLFGEIAGFEGQYHISGGCRYTFGTSAPENFNVPSIHSNTTDTWEPGVLLVFTGETGRSNFTGVYLWSKPYFLNGNDQIENVAFDNTTNSKLYARVNASNNGSFRFLVKSEGLYYISEALFECYGDESGFNRFELTGFSNNGNMGKRWSRFDPSVLALPEGNTMNYSQVDLSHVEEVGLIFSVGRENWAYSFGLIEFSAFGIQKIDDTEAPSTPANLMVDEQTNHSCQLSWDASTDNVGVGYYSVYQEGTTGKLQLIGTTDETWYRLENLDTLQTYRFSVQATDPAGNRSAMSDTLEVNLPTGPVIIATIDNVVSVYPNPTSDYLKVNIVQSGATSNLTIKLCSIDGPILFSQTLTYPEANLTIPVFGYKPGVYLLMVESDRFRQVDKVIVQVF